MAKNVAEVAAGARRNGNHKPKVGLKFERYFTPPGAHAYDLIEWERRTAAITPGWFNTAVPGRAQQGSACFINSVQDSMESILELVKTEGMLFKFGSGTGTNLSVLRSSREQLSGGGTASGPVSFMRGYD